MAGKRSLLALNSVFLSLASLAAVFQCYGLLLSMLIAQRHRQGRLTFQAANQYSIALARLRYQQRRIVCRRGRVWRKPGRTEQWWKNLLDGILPNTEWRKNLRMDREVFMKIASDLRPYLQPRRSPRGKDVLSVEKQLAMTLYYLKDQGSLAMTANSFGVALCTVSVVVRKVCDIIATVLGPQYIKLPSTPHEMTELVHGMENRYRFPQGFGCMDGTHIHISQPAESPHDYWSYKQKYTLNCQAVCDWRGRFIDCEVKWPGSVHDGRVFANSRINKLLQRQKMPMMYKELLPGHDKIPVTLLGDPAYPLLPYCMKEYPNPHTNEEVIFNNMLRSARNPIECAFGRLKVRWQILNKRMDIGLMNIPSIIYSCFVLHNICETLDGNNVDDDAVARQMARDRLQRQDGPDRLYSFNTAEGTHVRNITTLYYKEHIPH